MQQKHVTYVGMALYADNCKVPQSSEYDCTIDPAFCGPRSKSTSYRLVGGVFGNPTHRSLNDVWCLGRCLILQCPEAVKAYQLYWHLRAGLARYCSICTISGLLKLRYDCIPAQT